MDNVHAHKQLGFTQENYHKVNALFHDLKGVCAGILKLLNWEYKLIWLRILNVWLYTL